MVKANSSMVMAIIIAVLYFFSLPGVVWAFPEKNIATKTDPNVMNKTNAMFHAAAFGLALSFAYTPLFNIIAANI